jgi:hypothetical protein
VTGIERFKNVLMIQYCSDYMRRFEIIVKGNLGEYKQSGDVEIGTKDIVGALGAYFAHLHDEKNTNCPNPVAEGEIHIKIKYPTSP